MKILAGMTATLGFLAVALGAFGAHALKNSISSEMISVWKIAVQYQMFHVLVLLSIILLEQRDDRAQWQIIGWLFAIGCIVFSGSLYLLAISDIKIFWYDYSNRWRYALSRLANSVLFFNQRFE